MERPDSCGKRFSGKTVRRFVDYYYFIRTRENTIYVVEEDGAIRAMLQKNPYRMKLEDSVFDSEYIVGVATEKEYRSRVYAAASDRGAGRGK